MDRQALFEDQLPQKTNPVVGIFRQLSAFCRRHASTPQANALCIQIRKAFPFDRHFVIPYKSAEPKQEERVGKQSREFRVNGSGGRQFITQLKSVSGRKSFFSFDHLYTGDAR